MYLSSCFAASLKGECMREGLYPKRDLEREKRLVELISKIESRLDLVEDEKLVEELSSEFKEANSLITTEGSIIDVELIRYYYQWTSLEDLAGELTLNVKKVPDITKEELAEIIDYYRKVIITNEIVPDDYSFSYFEGFYHDFFEMNFPSFENLEDMIYEEIDSKKLADLVFNAGGNNVNVIYL